MAKDNFYARTGSVPYPEFGSESIVFNSIGFRHLLRKNGKTRPKNDQRRRLALLRYTISIITNPPSPAVFRKEKRTNFWMFQKKHNGITIKLIMRQLGNGKKHFYSIFSDKKKPPQAKEGPL